MKYLIPVLCSLLLIGCSESPPAQTSLNTSGEPQSIAPAQNEENTSAVPETVTPVAETLTAVPAAAVEKPAEPATKPVAKPSTKAIETPVAAEKTPPSVDASALFAQKCTSCHGTKGEKAALGKSQIIAGWSESKIKEALKGYQAGSYGKEMKALMQGQAKGLSDPQIDALAHYISAL
ncbi:MAG: c-type cytochrome [Sulfuricurvum sp.]|jgi:cytochrome c553|uniref:c-type cytochrome n=1 Tax=Sulfuricurvum sp. TaxID=2025608 RepID=UPI0025D9494D|nr:c-type cytochrome [Sulfuricurvum sp.]MCK9373731.1 c-type cytochrome [Sulfuricurvum sp.]